MRKERERYAAQTAGLKSELDSLKGLLQTYETSNQRKDEVTACICICFLSQYIVCLVGHGLSTRLRFNFQDLTCRHAKHVQEVNWHLSNYKWSVLA